MPGPYVISHVVSYMVSYVVSYVEFFKKDIYVLYTYKLHHFAPPKYYVSSRILIEVIKRFYLN